MSKPKLMLVVNPVSGKLKGLANLDALIAALEQTYAVDVYKTAARGDGTALTRTHIAAYDAVAGCGGDGTLNEILLALQELPAAQRKPVICIPAGTTNLLGDTLGLPRNVVAAAEAGAKGAEHDFDLGRMNEHCFGSVVAFGAFTDTSYAMSQKVKNRLGYGAYVLGGAKSLFRLRSYPMTVTVNGQTYTDRFIFGGISNCVAVGGIIRFADGTVQVGDGKYEVILVRRLRTPAAMWRAIKAVCRHKYDDVPEIICSLADEVHIEAEAPMPWTIDGEYKGDIQQVDISNTPAAMKFIY